MLTIIYGKNSLSGELEGFSPGTSEFEVTLDKDVKILFTSKSKSDSDMFDRMRIVMQNVGLAKLRNSVVNFNTGNISIEDGDSKQMSPKNRIHSTLMA